MDRSDQEAKLEIGAREATLLHGVCGIVAGGLDFYDSLQEILDLVCTHTKWPEGHVYELGSEQLRLAPVWFDRKLVRFERVRRLLTREDGTLGTSLSENVRQTGQPRLIQHGEFIDRLRQSTGSEIREALGIPILCRGRLVAILEFLSDRHHPRSPALLETMQIVGSQISRLYEQRKAAAELREARLAADSSNRFRRGLDSRLNHELKPALEDIAGISARLDQRPSLGKPERQAIEVIRSKCQHLLTLIAIMQDELLFAEDLFEPRSESLPLPFFETEENETPRADTSPIQAGGTHGQRKVLLLEEQPSLELDRLFEVLGDCQLQRVQSAEEALSWLETAPADLTLIDLGISGLGAAQIIQRIRAVPELRDLKVVALARRTFPDMLKRIRELGFDSFLAYPISLDELRSCLEPGVL